MPALLLTLLLLVVYVMTLPGASEGLKVYLLPDLLGTLFMRRGTVRYPFEPLKLPPYFRGRVVGVPENCRGCGRCAGRRWR